MGTHSPLLRSHVPQRLDLPPRALLHWPTRCSLSGFPSHTPIFHPRYLRGYGLSHWKWQSLKKKKKLAAQRRTRSKEAFGERQVAPFRVCPWTRWSAFPPLTPCLHKLTSLWGPARGGFTKRCLGLSQSEVTSACQAGTFSLDTGDVHSLTHYSCRERRSRHHPSSAGSVGRAPCPGRRGPAQNTSPGCWQDGKRRAAT